MFKEDISSWLFSKYFQKASTSDQKPGHLNKQFELKQTAPTWKYKGRSRTAATSKMELFVIIVIITKSSILDVVEVLDPSLKKSLQLWYLF